MKRIRLLFLMLLCVAGTALTARAQKVTLNFRNAKLEQVFGRITEQTGYTFYYARPTVNPDKVVSIAVADVDVRAALKQLLADDKVEIEIRDGKIYLSPPRQSAAVLQSVKGVVRDAAGQPVVGAAVIVKGTTRGVSSGTDGSFSFEGLADGAVLQVSALGYASAEIPVGNRSFVTVELKEDATLVDEVVVVGYGTQKKANLTGAVDQVSSELLENRPVANVTQMLQGAVPNLNISLADGKPNRSASYNIRGKTSIGAGGSALVLIDGVEGDPAMLNPNDIESVSVLKDAASAAIYGSRAPYGVVLITTKDPGKLTDKFTINYTGNVSIQQPTAIPDVVDDGYVYSRLFYDAWYNYRFNEPTGFNNSQDFSRAWLDTFRQRKLAGNKLETTVEPDGKYVYYGNTDYYDALYKDTVIAQTHNISVSGSNGKISHYLSGRLYDYNGLFNFTPDTYRTMNLRSKVSSQVFKWLKISNNFDYTHDRYRQPMGYSKEGGGVLWRSLNDQGHPSSPIFNPDGTLTKSGAYAIGGLVTGNNWLDRTTKTLKNTTTLNVTMLENRLRLTGDFSFRTKDYTETKKTTAIPYSAYEGEIVYLGTPETDDVMKESLQLTTYIATNAYAEFEDTFAEKHYFKALAGYNYEQQDYKSTYSERNGLLMPDADNINFALGDIMSITAGGSRWRYVGAFFRFNYAYDDRYLLEVNGRYDGSSKFPNNSQWGFFPSASAAWRVSQEKFWNVSPKAVSNLKLRASYGALGNSNVDPYTYLETFGLSTFGTGSGDAARYLFGQAKLRYTSLPGQIPDNIGWETSKTFDVGLDAGFLNGRLNLTADYYIRKTVDMYTVGPTLPDTFGATAPKGNYADMSTYGYEIALSYNDSFKLAGKPFNFGIKATLADYYSIIDRYNNASRKLSDYYEGQRLGEIWGFVCNGLFQSQAEIDAAFGGKGYKNDIMQTSEKYITYPGDMRFEDLNGNDAIDRGSSTVDDPGDRKIIGNSEPRYLYTISLNADWNGFFLSALFDGVGRQQWFPSDESLFWGMYNRPYNQVPTWHLQNYWTEERPNAYLPRYVGYYGPMNANTVNVNTRYLQDVSYIRLENLQFGYELPKRWISKIGLSKVSVYFSGENLWSWSPLYRHTKDFDVTVASKKSDSDISDSKGDGHNYPVMRSFSFGISITY